MDKSFQFQSPGRVLTNMRDLRKGQFPGQHHPASPQFVIGRGGCGVDDAGLGADMNLTVRRVAFCQCQHAQVGQDQRIRAHFIQRRQIVRQPGHFIIPGQGVDSHIDLHAPLMTVLHSFRHFFRGKVIGSGAHPKGLARQIDRVRAVSHGKAQLFHISGGRQHLRAAHQSYFPAATSATARSCSFWVLLKI